MVKKHEIETKTQYQLDDYSEKRNNDFQRFKDYADQVWKNDYENAFKEMNEDATRRR